MASDRQSFVLSLPWDGLCRMPGVGEVGLRERPGAVGATPGSNLGVSETYPAIPLFRTSNHPEHQKSLQIEAFRPTRGGRPPLPPARMSHTPPGNGAKHLCDPHEASRPAKSPTVLTAESFNPRLTGGADTTGDREEGENRRSRQAYSGRPARIAGWVPEASNGPAPRQFSGEDLERPNHSSACRRREQRHAGPRTPLRENEWRPRANYNEKEHIKCRQVEYDSC
jgi:hypothetical protein